MKYSTLVTLAASLVTLTSKVSAACLSGKVAVYWGQTSGTRDLSDICADPSVDIVLLSFLSAFGPSSMTLNLFPADCYPEYSNGAWTYACDGSNGYADIEGGIQTCHTNGKQVLLSIGGATGISSLTDDADGTAFGDLLLNSFGPHTDSSLSVRPIGNAQVDGFDFDIEAGTGTGLVAAAREIKAKSSLIITAAPQCPPDGGRELNVFPMLDAGVVDTAFIQFYNNPCTVSNGFNWDYWSTYAAQKGFTAFVGLPAATAAANAASYSEPSAIQEALQASVLASSDNFGGIAMWNDFFSESSQTNSKSFAANMKDLLSNSVCGSGAGGVSLASGSASISASGSVVVPFVGASSTSVTPLVVAESTVSNSYSESSSSSTSVLVSVAPSQTSSLSSITQTTSLLAASTTVPATSSSVASSASSISSSSASTTSSSALAVESLASRPLSVIGTNSDAPYPVVTVLSVSYVTITAPCTVQNVFQAQSTSAARLVKRANTSANSTETISTLSAMAPRTSYSALAALIGLAAMLF